MPIIAHSIRLAQASELFDDIIVTTDDDEIEAVARSYGASIHRRPPCDGTVGTQEVAARVIEETALTPPDYACVIYATAPLLLATDLIHARLVLTNGYRYVYGVGPDDEDAGAFYFGRASSFLERVSLSEGIPFWLPAERVCDINTPADWERALGLYASLKEGMTA